MNTRKGFAVLCVLAVLLLCTDRLRAAVGYNWQEYQGNQTLSGGSVSFGTLQMSNNFTTVKANFIKGIGSFIDNLVIFIDSQPGGITTTSQLVNKNNALEIAISGYKNSRSVATFAAGFGADYAIALGINSGSGLYRIVNDPGGPYIEQVRSGLNFLYADSPNHAVYSFQFDWTDLGLSSANTNFFKFESTYISSTGYRSLESFEGLTGQLGYDFITFTNYDTYGVEPIPENTNAALAVFGGIVLSAMVIKRVRHCV